MPTKTTASGKVLGRPSDFRVCTLNKETGEKGVVGGAWENPDGSISIVLNSHVTLSQSKAEIITAFRKDSRPANNPKTKGKVPF